MASQPGGCIINENTRGTKEIGKLSSVSNLTSDKASAELAEESFDHKEDPAELLLHSDSKATKPLDQNTETIDLSDNPIVTLPTTPSAHLYPDLTLPLSLGTEKDEPPPFPSIEFPVYSTIEDNFYDLAYVNKNYFRQLDTNSSEIREDFLDSWLELLNLEDDSLQPTRTTRQAIDDSKEKAIFKGESNLKLLVQTLFEDKYKNPERRPKIDKKRKTNSRKLSTVRH